MSAPWSLQFLPDGLMLIVERYGTMRTARMDGVVSAPIEGVLNIVRPRHDYGWPNVSYGLQYGGTPVGTGRHRADGIEEPIYFWIPSIAPSGMLFYTGQLFPEWRGDLFVGALAGQHLVRLALDGERVVAEERLLAELGQRIRDVRQGPEGAVYVSTDGGQLLRRLTNTHAARSHRDTPRMQRDVRCPKRVSSLQPLEG